MPNDPTPAPRILDMQLEERPRERLASRGAAALRNAELIAILLRTGVRGASAVAVAESLLQRFGTLEALARATVDELRIRGVGRDKAIALKAAFTLATRMAEELRRESPVLDTPDAIAALLRDEAAGWNVERLQVVMLNTRRRLIRVETVSEGILDQVPVHAREVFRRAIAANAHAIVLAHNHPSGDPLPSEADIRVTRDLNRAGHLLKIELLDHIILGRRSEHRPRDFVSLRELGYFHS
jgi:DNA repair protein RadC